MQVVVVVATVLAGVVGVCAQSEEKAEHRTECAAAFRGFWSLTDPRFRQALRLTDAGREATSRTRYDFC